MAVAARTTLTGVAPLFLVDDVDRTARWYRDVLGFNINAIYREHSHEHDEHGNHIDPADNEHHAEDGDGFAFFAILERDGMRVMLSVTVEAGRGVGSNAAFKEGTSDAYFWADDVQALFEGARSAVAAHGGQIALEPTDQFYGIREFQVVDCDGRLLTFGAPIEG